MSDVTTMTTTTTTSFGVKVSACDKLIIADHSLNSRVYFKLAADLKEGETITVPKPTIEWGKYAVMTEHIDIKFIGHFYTEMKCTDDDLEIKVLQDIKANERPVFSIGFTYKDKESAISKNIRNASTPKEKGAFVQYGANDCLYSGLTPKNDGKEVQLMHASEINKMAMVVDSMDLNPDMKTAFETVFKNSNIFNYYKSLVALRTIVMNGITNRDDLNGTLSGNLLTGAENFFYNALLYTSKTDDYALMRIVNRCHGTMKSVSPWSNTTFMCTVNAALIHDGRPVDPVYENLMKCEQFKAKNKNIYLTFAKNLAKVTKYTPASAN